MTGSKWSYIGVGTSAMLAFIGALTHGLGAMLLGVGLTIYNWYMAEHLRQQEDIALVEFIRTSLKDDIKK